MTRDRVLKALEENRERFLSGEEMAARIGVSRAAVWKAVEGLRGEGYDIESVPRRGHRLGSGSDVLSEEGIRRYLKNPELRIQVIPRIDSTNTALKRMAAEDAPAGLALAAEEQTAGRGRLGRSFYSPAGSGLYLSLLLRPETEIAETVKLTACAAAAAAEAIEELADVRPGIKWVNDLYLDGRKICGILTEAGLNCETGRTAYVVVGIGINTRRPAEDFPEEIRGIAGCAFGETPVPDLRNRLAAGILDRLAAWAENPGSPEIYEKYRARSMVPGKEILILSPGREPEAALVLDIERDYALRVRMPDGTERILCSGEISIRVSEPASGSRTPG